MNYIISITQNKQTKWQLLHNSFTLHETQNRMPCNWINNDWLDGCSADGNRWHYMFMVWTNVDIICFLNWKLRCASVDDGRLGSTALPIRSFCICSQWRKWVVKRTKSPLRRHFTAYVCIYGFYQWKNSFNFDVTRTSYTIQMDTIIISTRQPVNSRKGVR